MASLSFVLIDDLALVRSKTSYKYSISTEFETETVNVLTLAMLKRSLVLDSNLPLSSQLQILNLPGNLGETDHTSGYETLHSLLKLAISPYFDSFSKAQEELNTEAHVGSEVKAGESRLLVVFVCMLANSKNRGACYKEETGRTRVEFASVATRD